MNHIREELSNIQQIHQRAEIGLFIGEAKDRGKGYGSEVVKLMVGYGFRYINLNNIMLKVFSGNTAAINAYKKCGFTEIGKKNCFYFRWTIKKEMLRLMRDQMLNSR